MSSEDVDEGRAAVVSLGDGDGDGHGRIVVGVDGSPGSRAALVHALAMAAARGAEVEVVSAYPEPLAWAGEYPVHVPDPEDVRAEAEARIVALLADVRRDGGPGGIASADAVEVRVVALAGPAAPVLIARAEDADVLVVGSRGRGSVKSALLGSVALHCVTHARRPVVVVHPHLEVLAQPPVVIVGVDGSAESRAALAAGIEEAGRLGAEVEVVTAHPVTSYWVDAYGGAMPAIDDIRADARRRAEELVSEVLGELVARPSTPLTIRTVIAEGPAAEVLVDRARRAELLVVGTRGRGAFRALLLGSVALYSALHASCPVMVVRHGEGRAPDGTGNRQAESGRLATVGG